MNRRSWLILSVLSLGTLLVTLDASMILVAIPSVSGGLHATVDQVVWMLTGYTLVFAVLLIPCGRLGDMIERRNLFAVGALLLGAASALCGLAQTPEQLIAFRVLQGVGAGVATPQALTISYSVFPPERRGTAFGFGSAAAGLGIVAGPVLGGFVTSTLGWRWVFYLNVPIAAALVVGTFIVVPRVPARRRRRYDWIGVLLLTGSLLAVVFALAEGERYRWGAVLGAITIPGILVAGLALAAVFVVWERGRPEPLLPLPLFKDANLSIAVWLNFSMYVALAFPLAYQVYLQAGLGLSTLVAGLALVPMNVTYAITSPLGGWLTDRIGGKYVVMTGIALLALGLAGLAVVATSEPTPVASVLPLAVGGLGMAAFFSSVTVLAIRRVPPDMAGAASGVINAGRWVGGVVGLAVVGAIVQVALAASLGAGAAANGTTVPARPVGALARRALADGYVFALRWVLVGMVVLLVIGVLTCLGFATDRSAEPAPAAAPPSPSPDNRPRSSA